MRLAGGTPAFGPSCVWQAATAGSAVTNNGKRQSIQQIFRMLLP